MRQCAASTLATAVCKCRSRLPVVSLLAKLVGNVLQTVSMLKDQEDSCTCVAVQFWCHFAWRWAQCMCMAYVHVRGHVATQGRCLTATSLTRHKVMGF